VSERQVRTLHRALAPWAVAAGAATAGRLLVEPLLIERGMPVLVRWPLAATVMTTLMLPPAMVVAARRSGDYTFVEEAFRPGRMATACTIALAATEALVEANGYSSLGGRPARGLGLLLAWTGTFWHLAGSQDALTRRLLSVEEPANAEQLAFRCRALLGDPGLDPERRAVAQLNIAGALIALSARTDQDDRLGEAFALIDAVTATAPPPLAFSAARQMVAGMRAKARRTGDDVGWDDAIDLLTGAAQRTAAEHPEAIGLAHAARAERLEWRAAPARAGGRRTELLAEAAGAFVAAAATLPERHDHRALYEAHIARLRAATLGDDALDDAIAALRRAALRLQNAPDRHDRDAVRLALADLLVRRADVAPHSSLEQAVRSATAGVPLHDTLTRVWPDRGGNDIAQALWLYQSVVSSGEHGAEAAGRLPGIRDRAMKVKGFGGYPEWLVAQTGWMFKLVARKQAQASAGQATATALRWADWADARGDVDQAAAASWRWLTTSATDLRRRILLDKDPRVGDLQRHFTQAADRLVRAGRLADAAVALERGRAVLLTERSGRSRAGLEARLVEARRPDLAERWAAARATVERTDRAAFAPGGAGRTARGSAEYRALAEHEDLLREIGALPGFADVDAPPSYADLTAAAADGPLVYVVALEQRGFALIVEAGSSAPVLLRLPRLDRPWAEQASTVMGAARRGRAASRELGNLLLELWDRALGPVAGRLPRGALVTLVPIGPLVDLPGTPPAPRPTRTGYGTTASTGCCSGTRPTPDSCCTPAGPRTSRRRRRGRARS
jgi:hypothetical protein